MKRRIVSNSETSAPRKLVTRHLSFGWWSLLCFLSLGIVLESLHGFKVDFYLNAANETRRLMWTLAHAHGTLLSLVNVAFAATLHMLDREEAPWQRRASALFIGATALVPGGFFLGGVFIYGGDPGLGILALPVGALLLVLAVLTTALEVTRRGGGRP